MYRLEQLFERAPVGLAIWDREMRFVRVNDTLAAIHGAPVADHIGRTLSEVIGPLGAEAEARMRAILASGEPSVNMEFQGETPAEPGVRRHWLATHFPLYGDAGAIEGIAGVVVETTDNARAREREREARAAAEMLMNASMQLVASMEPAVVLEQIVDAATPGLGDVAEVHIVGEHDEGEPPELGMVRSGEVVVEGDGCRALLPLAARGRVLGVLSLASTDGRIRYDDGVIDTALAFARQAALALDNAQLYDERRRVAETMQRSLLPHRLPDIRGIDIATRYRAAGRSNEVGGDLYDVFSRSGGPCAFVVADVVGKGPEAAALTALARHTLRAAHLRGDGPDMALHLLNEALLESEAPARLITAVYGNLTWDGDAVAVTLGIAGHPPPLVAGPGPGVEAVDRPGLLLGVARDPEFGHAQLRLRPGQTLVLYTDGITELRGMEPRHGEALLRESVAEGAGSTAAELLELVERRAIEASGRLRDDMALLALRVTG